MSPLLLSLCCLAASSLTAQESSRPNIVVIFTDDLGYGDLACYGHPTIATPAIDRLAAEGTRFTQFYVASPVCSPSRAALLTGRYPLRSGCTGKRGVFFPNSPGGLPASELTIAEILHRAGYITMMAGKWHLGHLQEHLPIEHGFDRWLGVPYSNDMLWQKRGDPPFPLMDGHQIIDSGTRQADLTERYTDAVIDFIDHRVGRPFFVYLAHTFPHVPLYPSDAADGQSPRGAYGDVIADIDHSTARIVAHLQERDLAENTLLFFTSDNGPWLPKEQQGGSAGLLRGGKTTVWEGGMRVPAIAWWPGRVPAGRVERSVTSTLDLLPTLAGLAGAETPTDRALDGVDIGPLLLGKQQELGDRTFFYYRSGRIRAVRHGDWKLHIAPMDDQEPGSTKPPDGPLLYNLAIDPGEHYDLTGQRQDIVEQLTGMIKKQRAAIEPPPSQIDLATLDREATRHSLDYALAAPD